MDLFESFCENAIDAVEIFGRKRLFEMLKSEFSMVSNDNTLMTWTFIKLVFKSKSIDLTTISEGELFQELKFQNPTLISRPSDHWEDVLMTIRNTLSLWLFKYERQQKKDFTDYILTKEGFGAVC
jgi:hypothetical protein